MLELEKTYLVKFLPEDFFEKSHSKEIVDMYLPRSSEHPKLRIRRNWDVYEITKKEILVEGDASKQMEHTIRITREEFLALTKADAKKIEKIRYYYPWNGKIAEVDVFTWDLKWLVVIDFEFDDEGEKDAFQMPNFCLADITQEDFIAGGMICGKTYADIEAEVQRFGYVKIGV